MICNGEIINQRDPLTYCHGCGLYFLPDDLAEKHCHNCGREVPDDAKIKHFYQVDGKTKSVIIKLE